LVATTTGAATTAAVAVTAAARCASPNQENACWLKETQS
jgi:hypothetical protein